MITFLLILATICYLCIGLVVKTYVKVYKEDFYLEEDCYIIGLFWPIYIFVLTLCWLLNLLFKPITLFSERLENKMFQLKNSKENKPRIKIPFDSDLKEAEQEVEDILSSEEKYRTL